MAKTSKPANPLLNTGEQAEGVPGRKPDGRFLPGHSGNPGGRPKGARSRLNRMAEDFALTNGEGLLAIAYGMCLDRDAATLRLLLERIFPAKDWCPEPEPDLILGPLETVEDIKSASGRVIAAYRSGGVTSADVGKLHRVLAARLSIIAPGAKPPITLVDAGGGLMLARIRERLWKAQPREATFSLGPHTLTVDRDAWTLRLVRTFPPMSEGGGPAQQAAENIRLVLIECADAAEAGNLTDAHADGLNRVLADNLCLIAPEAAPPVLTLKAGRAE